MSAVRAHTLTAAMFFSTLAWQFVFVSLPLVGLGLRRRPAGAGA